MLTGCQKAKNTGWQTDGQTDRKTDRKTERLFSLVIKTKVVQNVNRMPERQKYRLTDRQTEGQMDRQTERQKDFSAQLSKQQLFIMSTGCQKAKKTDRQNASMTEQQGS